MSGLDGFFDHYFRWRPVNATFTGEHGYDDRLPDWSPEGLDAFAADIRRTSDDLGPPPAAVAATGVEAGTTTAPAGSASEALERLDREVAAGFLDIQLGELATGHFQHRNPALYTGEAIFGVIGLLLREFAPLPDRLRAVAARLDATPEFLDGAVRTLTGATRSASIVGPDLASPGSRAGAIPASWAERALRECEGARHLLDVGLARVLDAAGIDSGGRALRDAARRAQASFARFAGWLQQDARVDGAAGVAAGTEFFGLLLERGHFCREPAPELLRRARHDLQEERARLDTLAAAQDPGGWPAVQSRLMADHPTDEDYLACFGRVWRACRDRVLDADLVTWPSRPVEYVAVPDFAREAAPFLYFLPYRSPAPYDAAAVDDYLVPAVDASVSLEERRRRLTAANRSTIVLNHVVHHGATGHHVQNHHAHRSPSRIGCIAATDCASRIGMFAGGSMAEGWACYATDLMEEVAFLSPLEAVAQQHNRVRQAARAVVDVELHAGTMTEADAVAFYIDRTGMPEPAARAEVTKNGMFPGAAVMYWLGTGAIHALREACWRRDGSGFALRTFHDELLSYGSLPVAAVARSMLARRAG